jgi:extracellular elastinolytic metalloproteinase
LGIGAAAVVVAGLIPAMSPAGAATVSAQKPAAPEKIGNYDSRKDDSARKVLAARSAQIQANPKAGVRSLRKQLGIQGLVDIDPLTVTARRVARIDGFLTGPSTRKPENIAMDYIRGHADVFGLSSAAVSGLVLRQKYVDIAGITHLSYVQQVGGVTVFGNGVKAHITKKGQLLQVDGSPVPNLPASFTVPSLTAQQARDKAVEDVFGSSKASILKSASTADRQTSFSNGDQAKLVIFETLSGPQLAWQTITMKEGFISVIGANGRALFRQSMVAKDSATTWDNYPGAPVGGTQQNRDLTGPGWLPKNSPRLAGNVAHVFLDINDNDVADAGEEVPPSGNKSFAYPFTPFGGANCVTGFVCSWDPDTAFSWQTNKNQDAVQMFYFLGKMHDHLLKNPIGFTRTAGNFEAVDGDAVSGNAIDGANITGAGFPDGNHVDNANMSTPPDGISPRMQMYLFHQPGTLFPDEDPFIAGNSGDEADIVYHEYTHGLSNRLVVDANGVSTLGNLQAGSMGEAWSDWYATDFLVNEGFFTDTAADGDLRIGPYVGWGNDLIRTQPVDCSVGSTSAACPGTPGAGPGGYTYGDFGRIIGAPEVHADGEIWAETLWDLRKAIGSKLAESLVTRAMELSPANPSMLDERNSILAADLAVNGGKKQKQIWTVFAGRGMGWFAGSVDGDDTTPVEDFSMPPSPTTPTGSLTGVVRDRDTGTPIAGAIVAFGGHASGFAGSYAATTNASGQYTISGIFAGTYPKVFARGAGFDPVVQTVSVASRTNVLNWTLRRDWAATAGGASVVDFNGEDNSGFGCGPPQLFDQSQGSGDSTDVVFANPADDAVIDPRFVTVQLPVGVNIAELQINPTATCGDGGSASTGDFTVETSVDGVTFTLAASGHFGAAARGHMNTVPLNAGTGTNVHFLKYTMKGTQLHDSGGAANQCTNGPGGFSACAFVDSVEVAVYGAPAP